MASLKAAIDFLERGDYRWILEKNQRYSWYQMFLVSCMISFLNLQTRNQSMHRYYRPLVRTILALCLAIPFFLSAASAMELTLASDPWCPYTCDPGSSNPGYMVELAREILGQENIRFHYQVKPWKRVLAESKTGAIDGAITADLSDTENLILNRIPFAATSQTVVSRIDDSFQWAGIDSIGTRILVAINGYTYGKAISKWMESRQDSGRVHMISGVDALTRSLRMIATKRGDILVNDLNVLKYTLAGMKLQTEFRFQATGLKTDLFIGITKKRGDAQLIVDTLDKGLASPDNQDLIASLKYKYLIR